MFILAAQRDRDVAEAFRRYAEYVESMRDAFPPGALELARSDWYFDFNDRRCPHDGWLESVSIRELGTGDRSSIRVSELRVRLLGAYHDGHVELLYTGVRGYELSGSDVSGGHGDWGYDEFRLGADNRLVHEIEWSGGSRWLIECEDVVHKWLPMKLELTEG